MASPLSVVSALAPVPDLAPPVPERTSEPAETCDSTLYA